ncbi:hypothetical protein JZ751_007235 [Albula glossodonta]|uniref:C2H2-type domain-containing protein n=1 Tax=Albula glossodonta TaxID=121402 RepID=A0A8T2N5L3_9TELE|nr:hypothetical protein JZ751_007235 [Albula glossodonta]
MGQTTGTPGTAAPGKPAQTTATPATATPAMATSATATQAAATEATAKGTHQTSVKPQHLFSSFKLKRPAPSATQSTKIAPRLLSPAPPAVAQSKTAVAPPKTLWANKMCPRCGSQYRVVEALRGHYCSPELTKGLQAMGKAGAANVRPPPTVTAPSATSKAFTPKTATAAARPGRSSTAISPPPSSLPSPPPSQTEEGEPEIQGKLIMLVDDFYYGQDDGRGELESWDPAQQGPCHLENVHSQYESTTKCKICEWAFENEPVCEYRSSLYSDVFSHFRNSHKDTVNLLCPYCLKVFRSNSNYQHHYIRHQVNH